MAADGEQYASKIPDAVKRAALSIETFHKASLVHDDIEDDDEFRYGDTTIHRRFGIPTAINVGDYLIGLGYRLVSREGSALGAECVSDIVDCLARAHMKLAEGQGAELLWRDARDKQLSPLDAFENLCAEKRRPAFEAALYTGVRLAGPAEKYAEPIAQFSRHLGVAFQILNDLNDWEGDDHNKLISGGDVLGGRPTILWALAMSQANEEQRQTMQQLVCDDDLTHEHRISQVRQWYEQTNVFETARELVDKYQSRAEEVADEVEPDELRRILYYLVDSILERPAEADVVTIPLVSLENSLAVDSVS